MKKTTILYLLSLGCLFLIFSSYTQGPAQVGDYECTGAETGLGNPTGCNAGSGCHSSSATAGINVAIELDSAGVPTTNYTGGNSYTIKLTGTNNTSSTLRRFGFQIGSIKGAVSQVTPVNAGAWATPYPANTHYTSPKASFFAVGVVEHSTPLSPTTGTGSNGSIYSETFKWTAPAPGVGTVSIWAALNAVNANGSADAGDLWNTNHVVIDEWSVTTGFASLEKNSFDVTVFPNPASNYAALDYTLDNNINIEVALFDLEGKKVCSLLSGNQLAGLHHEILNFSEKNLKSGIYLVVINAGNAVSSRQLIIQ